MDRDRDGGIIIIIIINFTVCSIICRPFMQYNTSNLRLTILPPS
jgi:hypothetical protein